MAGERSNAAQRDEIERIVREVLAQLVGGSNGSPVPAAGELVVVTKVISLQELDGRLEGVTRVVVPRGAVITPAAREELCRRQVAIASAVTSSKPQTTRLLIARAETNYELDGLIGVLTNDGIPAERLPDTDLVAAVDALCKHVASASNPALLITTHSAAALCLANRQRGVRAALGTSATAVSAAVASVAPNLLVIDPLGMSVFEMRQMVRAWQAARAECSPELRERLG